MKISIAMATYNGAQYLQAQLESFAAQTRLPDELVVCDDKSTDKTIEILTSFAKTVKFNVLIICNDENIGFARNFEKSMELCSGDLIFLCDQDDVWFSTKIETVETLFQKSPNLLVAINDVEVTNENLVTTGRTLLEGMRKTGRTSLKYHVLGCATVFRSKFRSIMLPLPLVGNEKSEVLAHDVWIHNLSRSCQARVVLEKTLQFYRRHTRTVTNFDTKSPIQQLTEFVMSSSDPQSIFSRSEKILEEVERRLILIRESNSSDLVFSMPISELISSVERERLALKNRINLQEFSGFIRLYKATKMWANGDYNYFLGWKSLGKDLLR